MSLYQQLVPVYVKYLKALSAMLDKTVKFCAEKELTHEDILTFRLVSDQQGLPYQVKSCSNTAKLALQRLGAKDMPFFEDDESTFPELQGRIAKTIEVLEGIDPETLDAGAASREFLMETKMGTFKFETGQHYVSEFAIPNFHFHLSTAYCILRYRGVPLGAMDYMKDVFHKA